MESHQELKKTLGPVMLWGLGVGYVISGMYFGWNLGLPEGGPYGMLAASLIVTVMYVAFILSYTELTCAIPHAGGVFVYATRGLGPTLGFLGGAAQIIEFVFAPPAIAMAIGAYFNFFFPNLNPLYTAVFVYVAFTALNIYGVQHSAAFELFVTVLAVAELLLFAGVTLPHFSLAKFSIDPLPKGWMGIFPSLPFAIWFYLAIEGIANVAEETRDHQRDPIIGGLSAMATLVVCATLTFFAATGVGGWKAIVYKAGTDTTSDTPLYPWIPATALALAILCLAAMTFYNLKLAAEYAALVAAGYAWALLAARTKRSRALEPAQSTQQP